MLLQGSGAQLETQTPVANAPKFESTKHCVSHEVKQILQQQQQQHRLPLQDTHNSYAALNSTSPALQRTPWMPLTSEVEAGLQVHCGQGFAQPGVAWNAPAMPATQAKVQSQELPAVKMISELHVAGAEAAASAAAARVSIQGARYFPVTHAMQSLVFSPIHAI
jgi:hypothetical protein